MAKKEKGMAVQGKPLRVNPPKSVEIERIEGRVERLKKYMRQRAERLAMHPETLAEYERALRKNELKLKYLKEDF
jgi:hypothetical protein